MLVASMTVFGLSFYLDVNISVSFSVAQHTLRVLENRVLRNTVGPKMDRE